MDQKWKDIMERLLGKVLYHGWIPEESSWCEEYSYEIENMMKDIKEFYRSSTDAGLEVSNETMAHFLVYAERQHIDNTHLSIRAQLTNCSYLQLRRRLMISSTNSVIE